MNIQNIEKKEKNMATFEVKVPADVFDNAVNEAYKKNKNWRRMRSRQVVPTAALSASARRA